MAGSTMTLQPGDVLVIRFPAQQLTGREQEGLRPSILLAIPNELGIPRFPMLVVVPVTTDTGQPWVLSSPGLYPRLAVGVANLNNASVVLLDQVCSVDRVRVGRCIGSLTSGQYDPICNALQRLFAERKNVPNTEDQ
jgi:mRNA interferase MazF